MAGRWGLVLVTGMGRPKVSGSGSLVEWQIGAGRTTLGRNRMNLLPLLFLIGLTATVPAPAPSAVDVAGVPVTLALEVRAGRRSIALPLAWRSEAGEVIATASAPELDAEARLVAEEGVGRRLRVRLRWRRAASLERAAVTLAWTGDAAWAVGRDLRPSPLAAAVRTGRGTPLLAGAGNLLLTGGPGLVAALLTPARDGLQATLFLDDAPERPFATYLACLEKLPRFDQVSPTAYGALERKHAWTGSSRRPGDEDRLEAVLWPVGPGRAMPIVVERWPRGARAAVVFTDHADRTDPAALRAVLFGHSDPRAEGSRGAGLLGRGLRITRSFFVWPGPGTLADPATWRLASWLVGAGSDVALHSISDLRDDREAIRAGLEAAGPLRPETWIDHEPYVNCEALSAQGAIERSPWDARELLVEGGIRWVWAAGDVAGFRAVEVRDLFTAAPPGEPSPAVYPLPGEPRLWVFQSSFFYAPPPELARALSDEPLDQLERGRGLFVAHTYLGTGPATTSWGPAAARIPVRQLEGGALVIDPALDEALARLASRVADGRLASLTWVEAGDRLRALGDVEVRYLADGGAEVVNRGDFTLGGLTVALPATGLQLWVDGEPAEARQEVAGASRIWFDLPARGRRVVRATRGLIPVPLLPPPSP
jgi:hypothetical protein